MCCVRESRGRTGREVVKWSHSSGNASGIWLHNPLSFILPYFLVSSVVRRFLSQWPCLVSATGKEKRIFEDPTFPHWHSSFRSCDKIKYWCLCGCESHAVDAGRKIKKMGKRKSDLSVVSYLSPSSSSAARRRGALFLVMITRTCVNLWDPEVISKWIVSSISRSRTGSCPLLASSWDENMSSLWLQLPSSSCNTKYLFCQAFSRVSEVNFAY